MIHEIDEHIEAHEAAENGVDTSSFSEVQLKMFNVCGIFQKVRPVIKFARGLLFWKPKWQKVIDDFLQIADEACPVE